MRYPCAWLSTLTPGHIQPGKPAGVRPRSGPAAVNAKAERYRVARQGVADASAQGCVRPLARGRPVTPGPPRRNPWHGALGAPPPRIGGGERKETTGRPRRPHQAWGRTKPGDDVVRLKGCLLPRQHLGQQPPVALDRLADGEAKLNLPAACRHRMYDRDPQVLLQKVDDRQHAPAGAEEIDRVGLLVLEEGALD